METIYEVKNRMKKNQTKQWRGGAKGKIRACNKIYKRSKRKKKTKANNIIQKRNLIRSKKRKTGKER